MASHKPKYAIGKFCVICGDKAYSYSYSDSIYKNKLVCRKHHNQLYLYNKIVRTIKDKNEIIIDQENNCAYVILRNKKQEIVGEAIIDIEDIDKVKNIKWALSHGYPRGNAKHMSSIILNYKTNSKQVIDHINHDKLDHRKQNLKKCTQQQNCFNSSMLKNNTSGCKGIYFRDNKWKSAKKKWHANIGINGKQIYLGNFKTKQEAIKVRKKAEIKYFK
jgi:hypothetical protein